MKGQLQIAQIDTWEAKIKIVTALPNFNHCKSEDMHDMLLQMFAKDPPRFRLLLSLFREARLPLSDCQASTVKHCVALSSTQRRQLWRAEAGMGKSHLIYFAALYLVSAKPNATVYIVYSNSALMEKDAHLLEAVKTLSKASRRLKPALAKTSVKPKADDFVLIDECDEVYLSNLDWYVRTMSAPTVIGFTATVPSVAETHEEKIMTDFFGANIYDSQLALKLRKGEPGLLFDEPKHINYTAVPKMIIKRTGPVIVYCTEEG